MDVIYRILHILWMYIYLIFSNMSTSNFTNRLVNTPNNWILILEMLFIQSYLIRLHCIQKNAIQWITFRQMRAMNTDLCTYFLNICIPTYISFPMDSISPHWQPPADELLSKSHVSTRALFSLNTCNIDMEICASTCSLLCTNVWQRGMNTARNVSAYNWRDIRVYTQNIPVYLKHIYDDCCADWCYQIFDQFNPYPSFEYYL